MLRHLPTHITVDFYSVSQISQMTLPALKVSWCIFLRSLANKNCKINRNGLAFLFLLLVGLWEHPQATYLYFICVSVERTCVFWITKCQEGSQMTQAKIVRIEQPTLSPIAFSYWRNENILCFEMLQSVWAECHNFRRALELQEILPKLRFTVIIT